MTIIRPAVFPADANSVSVIWRAFVAASPVDLAYQRNDADFADLPGKYAAPDGCILIADRGGSTEGCVALRKVSTTICEMKRLYVSPDARGGGLGRALAERAIAAARTMGYREIRLDVMPQSLVARGLYAALGFVDAPAVSFNPVADASFLGLRL